tara:strand:- start:16948 stop:20181 length:3234 start_codon:yes stop_codon:yes gene_type:complete
MFVAALIVTGLVFLVIQLAPQTIGETARRHLLKQLQQHYRDYHVTIRRGHYQTDLGLVFDDIRIADPSRSSSGQSPASALVRIDRLVVVAEFDRDKLVQQQNPFVSKRIIVEGLQADTTVDSSGELSIAKLWPLPKFGPAAPRVELHRTELKLRGGRHPHHPLALQLDKMLLTTDPVTGTRRIAATGNAPFISSLNLQAEMNGSAVSIQGQSRGFHISQELIDRLPSGYTKALTEVRSLDAFVDTAFALTHSSQGELDYSVRASINDAQFDHVALPKPITQIRGLVTCDKSGLRIQESQGRFGDAIVRANGTINPQSWPHGSQIQLSADGLLLDGHLARRLSPAMRAAWDKLQPYGHIDVDRATVAYVDGRWNASGVVQAKGVNVLFEKMPYPAEQLVGQVDIADGIATCYEMNGRVGGRRMKCAFRMPIMPGVTNEKLFRIRMDGPVAIDNTLVDALSPRGETESKLESFVRSLHPQGAAHLVDAMFHTDVDGRQSRSIDLRIVNGHLRYDKFAYPLYNVTGQVKVQDDLVTLTDFDANNSSAGQVACQGWYRMPAKSEPLTLDAISGTDATALAIKQQPAMKLTFNAKQIAMDGSLRSSLPETSRHAWDAVSPGGVLDQLDVVVTQAEHTDRITTDITAIQHGGQTVTNRVLSLQPPALPYRLDVLHGSVRFDGRQVLIDSLSTRHDATRVSADGKCVRGEDDRWNLMLNILGGSRLHPDAELIAALPSQLREAMHRLQLRGPLSLRGTAQVLLADAKHPDPTVNWDLNMQLEGNRIGDVGPVHAMRGEVRTTGSSSSSGMRAIGEVQIDSMHINDLHVTAIKGPFVINDDRLQLGGHTKTSEGRSAPQHLTGKIFGGTAELRGDVVLSSGKFDVSTSISRGQVPTLLSDLGKGRSELKGTFNVASRLEGFLGTTELLKGTGSANVSGANLYQLPLLVQLLNLLRITPTEDVAFTDGNADFQIIENEINFSKLQLWGDLVALDGGGTMNRRRELDLTFNTRVSPQNSFTRVVRPLRVGKYTLLTVDVRGPVDAPMVQRRTFDGVSETLEKLFPVMTEASEQRQQQAGSWWPSFLR